MSFASAIAVQAEKFLEWANKWHQTVVIWTIVGSTFAIVLGVLANMAGIPRFNFILAAVALLAGIFFLTKPAIVLSVFGLGSLTSGLPDLKIGEILKGNIPNFELKKFLGAGWDAIKATAHQVAHVLFFLTVLFVVLGTFPISDPALVLPALVILTGFGLWSALFAKGSIWYRRITIAILLVSGGVIFFKMYEPPKSMTERIEAAQEQNRDKLVDNALKPILRKAEGGYKLSSEENELLEKAKEREEKKSLLNKISEPLKQYRKVIYHPLRSYQDQQICGIRKGEWKWRLEKIYATNSVDTSGNPIDRFNPINGFMTLGGAPAGETMGKVNKDGGCITLSFPAFNEDVKSRNPVPVPITIIIGE